MENKNELEYFLKQQKLLALSTVDEHNNPWICNVYYSVDSELNLFFVSSPESNHGQHLNKNSQVAFSIAWFDQENLGNRKAVQGTGICERVKQKSEVLRLLENHYKYYPSWKSTINFKAMAEDKIASRPYVIKPTYMKFWNDELFGNEGLREFRF